ncbi:methyl-accepting chemotaxis protein [Actinoplanes sp. NPDC051851]|uniref:methyl-accepting chemotaxis protein n=1 Tax=Actinoplanes sp. NPDC051851 TaxID=3154753 RepID=UPI003425BA57
MLLLVLVAFLATIAVGAGVRSIRVRRRRSAPAVPEEPESDLEGLRRALAEKDAELDHLRADRAARAEAAGAQERQLNQRLRRRAKEAIDDTAAVIGDKLEVVVTHVGAARSATDDTQRRVGSTSAAAEALVRRARSADEAATALNASLRQVAGIAGVISGIASQTRLLALNATIEAVRAGTAGSGFAVVADEVKGLADTTADSTEQITSTIAALEADVAQMGETLSAIIHDVGDIEEAMRQLGGIADRQHGIVLELHRSVDATMAQIGDLGSVAERLERRRHDRVAVEGSARLQVPGTPQPVTAQLIDLSQDGFGCLVPAGARIAAGNRVDAVLTLDGRTLTAGARVMRHLPREGGAEVGCQFEDLPEPVREEIEAHLGSIGAS